LKLIIALCGASGINYGISLLKELKKKKIETHVIISEWAEYLIKKETKCKLSDVKKLAKKIYGYKEMDAAIASSSFLVDGMIVIPATVKTCSEIARADCANLISRAADNILKTKKKLVVATRETPLSLPATKNLYEIAQAGGIIFPLSPGFYHNPKTIKDLEDFIVGKILDLFEIKNDIYKRWNK